MQILKGAPVAAAIRDEIKKELEGCETKPCLAIVRVGEKQEDLSYERSALKRMSGVGIETKLFVFPADISMDDFSAKFAAMIQRSMAFYCFVRFRHSLMSHRLLNQLLQKRM